MRWDYFVWWRWVLMMGLAFLLLLMMVGCKGKEYVAVPQYRTEYVVSRDTVAVVDSVTVRDSVLVYKNGDSVVITKILYSDRSKDRWRTRTDTVLVTDTISVPANASGNPPELSTWQRLRLGLGDAVLIVILLYVMTWLGRRYH